MTRREYRLLRIIQIAALGILGVTLLLELYREEEPWWLAAAALAALAALLARWPERHYRLYLVAQAALTGVLMLLEPSFVVFAFSISGIAPTLFPNREAMLWIAVVAVLTGVAFVYNLGWSAGLLSTSALTGGFVSFALLSYSRVRAERARRESEALLEELQEAHRKLQDYAARVEELAVAEERNRLAREMHDTLGHRLTVAAVQLEGAQRLIPTAPERASHMVGTVRDQVREALDQLRRLVATLRTPLEADLALPEALTRLATGFEGATGIAVRLTLPEHKLDLPDLHRLALYRAAQEGLTNVQRHAEAQDAWLRLALQEDAVILTVEDNGTGYPPGAGNAGFGLRGMRERAAQLGGELVLGSRSGGGAQLVVRLPLPAEGRDG